MDDAPSNIDAEAALLGAILIENAALDGLRVALAPEHFFEPVHARIFERIVAKRAEGKCVTPVTLKPYFEHDEELSELGGTAYLARLTGDSGGLLATRELAQQIVDLAQRRTLLERLAAAREQALDPDAPWPDLAALTVQQSSDTLPLLDLGELVNRHPEPRAFALAKFIPQGEVTLFTGPGGSSKSLLAQQLATAVATGTLFLGLEVARGGALYATAEDDRRELEWRQHHIARRLGVAIDAADLHLASLRGRPDNHLCTFDAEGRLRPSPSFRALAATIQATGATFVALDNVAHLFAGNENDRSQVTQFANLLNRLAQETGATVLLIGHPNKSGDSYSGSTAWLNAVRSQIVLDWHRDSEGSIPDPDARELRLGKSNYARADERLAFRWHEFALVRDEDLPADVREELAATIRASGDNEVFLRCLDERNRQERPVSERKASRTYAPKEFTDMAESKGIGRARLEAAMERLFRIGEIERGFVYRDHGEGKDRHGLRRHSADLSADLPLTPPADLRSVPRRPPLTHTLDTTYLPGAGPEGRPPPDDELDWDGEFAEGDECPPR